MSVPNTSSREDEIVVSFRLTGDILAQVEAGASALLASTHRTTPTEDDIERARAAVCVSAIRHHLRDWGMKPSSLEFWTEWRERHTRERV